ncbi:MAG: hypothetical protein EBS34_13355, partial [Flavobacteriales bacterium]|nr:hypothetical protein [Flavobacteriales bacterium]
MTAILNYSEWKNLYEQSMGGMATPQTFAQASTDSVKKAMSYSLSDVIEGLREFLSGGTGLIVQVLIDIFGGPFGAFINVGAWSSL